MALCTGVLAGILLFAAPAFAGPSSGAATSTGTVTRTERITSAALPQVTMAAVDAKGAIHTMVAPPGGGCNYSKIIGGFTADYQGGALTRVIGGYASSIDCTTTASDQYMARLYNQATLWHYPDKVQDATKGICTNCNNTSSTGYYFCADGKNCAGWYQIRAVAEMQLPAGYSWTGTTPSGCQLVASDTLNCTVYTYWFYIWPSQ
jgi:hypothetical protein